MTILAVHSLAKSFGGVQAVKNVSFTLDPGELLALIGPNGAGKTTCFNMLNGQLAPDAGSVRLGDAELIGRRPREIWRLGVGRTFQITATYPSMTVRENVQVALLSHHRELAGVLRVVVAVAVVSEKDVVGPKGVAGVHHGIRAKSTEQAHDHVDRSDSIGRCVLDVLRLRIGVVVRGGHGCGIRRERHAEGGCKARKQQMEAKVHEAFLPSLDRQWAVTTETLGGVVNPVTEEPLDGEEDPPPPPQLARKTMRNAWAIMATNLDT